MFQVSLPQILVGSGFPVPVMHPGMIDDVVECNVVKCESCIGKKSCSGEGKEMKLKLGCW